MPNRLIINIRGVLNISLLFATLMLFVSFQPAKNAPVQLTLKNEPQKLKLAGFKIDEVSDVLPKSTSLGTLISEKGQSHLFSLKGGTPSAVKNYIEANTTSKDNARPVRISIKKLALTEMVNTAGGITGDLQVQFAFDLITGDSLYVHLVDYKGVIKYTRQSNQRDVAEQYIRDGIQNSLKFFAEWLEKHKNNDAALANTIEVVFSDYTEQPEGDTIYYSPKRPLTWDDFQDKLLHTTFSAQVIPGLGFNENNRVKDGQLIIEISLKVFLPKSAAWVKRGEENELNLNHEQRHFDIVKIIGERFKRAILSQNLPVHNYDGYINVTYFDALRQVEVMQKLYDRETNHGSNEGQQRRWNMKIDAELAGGVSGG